MFREGMSDVVGGVRLVDNGQLALIEDFLARHPDAPNANQVRDWLQNFANGSKTERLEEFA